MRTLAFIAAMALAEPALAQSGQFTWENKSLLNLAGMTNEPYVDGFNQANARCTPIAQGLVQVPRTDCSRALSSPSMEVGDICLKTGVDCTSAFASASMQLADQCVARARQVHAALQYQAGQVFKQCMAEDGWRWVPKQQ